MFSVFDAVEHVVGRHVAGLVDQVVGVDAALGEHACSSRRAA